MLREFYRREHRTVLVLHQDPGMWASAFLGMSVPGSRFQGDCTDRALL